MSEHDANRWLMDTIVLKQADHILDVRDPLEMTQRMPVADRRYRQHEARATALGAGRSPDFRDNSRQHRMTVHDINQQDGFPDAE